ncbi:MAG: LysE family translocator [Pseudomonadota bacterium]
MAWETYLVYLGVVAAFFATPPDTSQLLVMSNSLRHGVRRSLWTVAGDLSANTLQMLAAGFGLTALIALSADGLTVIKWLGVAYLAWLGLSLILRREPSPESASSPASATRPGILFRQGFLTSSANPYAVVFFGALFPQFIDPALAIWPQLLILGATYLVIDGVILVLWGWAATRTLGPLKALGGAWLNRICGGLMIAAAGLLASKDLTAEAPR